MQEFRRHTTKEMVEAHRRVKSHGLTSIGLGNLGVFVRCEQDREYLLANVDEGAH